MSIYREKQFTVQDAPEDLHIFCRAEAAECGKSFALPAPRLEYGMLFSVRSVFSRDYLFTAADGLSLTVTACDHSVIRPGLVTKRHAFRRPVSAVRGFAAPVRKTTVLRL